ncbi:MAG: DUF177 domain-containing protein [Clostridium sp.]|jgi:uncharacterized protein|uniref:YceD family protein n=1 Tax=Clostridium sp. TaxID=1506 RepID=UPI0025C1C123|nr:DUF177 domain-containing protein [Clostridium sp.]MCH3964020.1 DUF177 domain-containing protein [Clostridium sp.]MCI1716221.1 DUF177 domain-containing protein [Clostridium sp.]MCI1800539.1 DUF177 domain-containing protein [Clostridium sp.]MCI1814398.1 DUF177 domain-containing protein [Clostridium sp.]MCI1871297.1 DUF177 domain-containing protein [Clostridium sp.]
MKLDVSSLLDNETLDKDLDITLEESSFYDGGEYIDILKPIRFSGTLKKVGDLFVLTGNVNTVLGLTCSRCLEKFSYPMKIEINENFTGRKTVDEGDDVIFIDNDYIDITEVIENNIILMLPIKRLCKKDCRGLCPKCGTNLNYSTCDCSKDEIDPRWAKLKNMFSSN